MDAWGASENRRRSSQSKRSATREAEMDGTKPALATDGLQAEKESDVVTNASLAEWLEGELNDLRRIRDELRVRAHLGKAELRDRWQALEQAFQRLEQDAKRIGVAAEQPLQRLEDDARQLVRDLREGYRRIRDAI